MQSSPSSNSASSEPALPSSENQVKTGTASTGSLKNRIIDIVTWILRLFIGGVFIYSGFVKAVDPWGTFYKFGEYFAAMGIPSIAPLTLVFAFCLFTSEFLTGVFFVTGSYRRVAPIFAIIFMALMLPLTLWIAVADPVADCGCFGDALVISNWATFWKNVILTAGIVWLIIYNRRCACLVTPALQWIALIVSAVYPIVLGLVGYVRQPMMDFRPYPEGSELFSLAAEDSEPTFVFVYEKDGVKKEFREDDELPDEAEGWNFVERKEIKRDTGKTAGEEKNLRVWDRTGEEDLTEEVSSPEGEKLFLMIPDISGVSAATTWKINSMYSWARKHNIEMSAIVSGSAEDVAHWEDISMPEYPIYTADDTSIKEVVRGNPGVVFVKDGHIVWKSTLGALDADDFMSGHDYKAMELRYDLRRALVNYTWIYVIAMILLSALSFFPMIIRRFTR